MKPDDYVLADLGSEAACRAVAISWDTYGLLNTFLGFLCIKGCYLSDAKCPLCRGNIPKKCIEKPKLVDSEDKGKKSRKRKKSCTGGASKKSKNSVPAVANESSDASVSELPPELVWFYEGRNGGWWQYDERTEVLINQAVSKGENSLEVLLAGNVYVLDFVGRLQMLKSNPSVKRNMKQDVPNAPDTKGIAGLDMKS